MKIIKALKDSVFLMIAGISLICVSEEQQKIWVENMYGIFK